MLPTTHEAASEQLFPGPLGSEGDRAGARGLHCSPQSPFFLPSGGGLEPALRGTGMKRCGSANPPIPWPAVQVGDRLSQHVLPSPQACPLTFWAPMTTRLVMS